MRLLEHYGLSFTPLLRSAVRFKYRLKVTLDERAILPRRGFTMIQHIFRGGTHFGRDIVVIQLRALLPARCTHILPSDACALHPFYTLLPQFDRKRCGSALTRAALSLSS